MANLVLFEVRYVLASICYSFRCISSPITFSWFETALYWLMSFIPTAFLAIPQLVYMFLDTESLHEFVTVLVPFTEIALTIVKMVLCNVKRSEIISLINQVQTEWMEYESSMRSEIGELVAATTKKVRLFTIIYTLLFGVLGLEFGLLPVTRLIYYKVFGSGTTNYTITLPYTQRSFYSIEGTTSFTITYFWIIVAVYLLVMSLSALDCVFDTLAMHITGLFKLLNAEVDQMSVELRAGVDAKQMRQTFKRLVLKHKTYLALIDRLEDAFSVYMIFQFVTSSIVICVVLYQFTTVFGWNGETIKTSTYLPGAIIQLYVFCWYAEEMTEEAAMVADHIYNIPWYLGDIRLQKMFLTLMVKAQKPTGVTAGKFYLITLQSFQQIIRASYSYFTLLSTVMQE
ncbi:odorant receptor 4-like [Anopheles cruzii]|uniref:odorant receptor 4-like n=1 Tax=Anopheles cruzii TaxID=68878 RepID=UPI0022EC2BCC|nr:odorant receptor 4-like [Anopheles cruzii]